MQKRLQHPAVAAEMTRGEPEEETAQQGPPARRTPGVLSKLEAAEKQEPPSCALTPVITQLGRVVYQMMQLSSWRRLRSELVQKKLHRLSVAVQEPEVEMVQQGSSARSTPVAVSKSGATQKREPSCGPTLART